MLALSVLPVLAFRGQGAEAEIRGGLFQDFAPSVFHLQHVIVPMLAQMGLAAEIEMIRPGYVPAGEGIIRLAVPAGVRPLRPLLPRRGKMPARVWGISLASHLDDRQVAVLGPKGPAESRGDDPCRPHQLPDGTVRWHCDSELKGVTVNPWDLFRIPGHPAAARPRRSRPA